MTFKELLKVCNNDEYAVIYNDIEEIDDTPSINEVDYCFKRISSEYDNVYKCDFLNEKMLNGTVEKLGTMFNEKEETIIYVLIKTNDHTF